MKNFFKLVAGCVNINTDILNAMGNGMRREGAAVPALIKEVREGIQESGLTAAVANNLAANEAQSANVPSWVGELETELKGLKTALKLGFESPAKKLS